ncbi:MAG: lysostaphin resistance A-like protein [Oscillospiraceae bacterium]
MNNYGQFTPLPPNQLPPQMYYQSFEVAPDEKRRIRHNYNVIGLTLLILYILIAVACYSAYYFAYPEPQYNEDGMLILNMADMIICCCFPAVMALIVFAGYCIFAGYNPVELFTLKNVSGKETFKYVMLVLFAQQISFICTIFISIFLSSMGLEVSGLNYVLEHKPSVYAVDVFSSVFLAPIAEELIYRGVVLRCSAKISQRFAIFFSAFIFGIMHGNPYQFILGFLIGIPLAIITIKTGSLIPAIICHMTNNIVASIPSVVEYFNEELSYSINFIIMPIFLIAGLIVLVSELSSGRLKLPEYNQHHRKRTMPILITSWSIITIMVFYVIDLVMSIQPIAETAANAAA